MKRVIDCRCEQKNTSFFEIDGMGYFVKNFDKLEDLSEEFLRGKPTRLEVSEILIIGGSFLEAINSFNNYCPGASFGKDPALYIDTSRPIIGINCPRINCNCSGELICGEEISRLLTKSGTFGFCLLEERISSQCDCEVRQKISKRDCSLEVVTVGEKNYMVAEVRVP